MNTIDPRFEYVNVLEKYTFSAHFYCDAMYANTFDLSTCIVATFSNVRNRSFTPVRY